MPVAQKPILVIKYKKTHNFSQHFQQSGFSPWAMVFEQSQIFQKVGRGKSNLNFLFYTPKYHNQKMSLNFL